MEFTCAECGSLDVSSKCWANPNDDVISDYVGDDIEDNWCNECGKHVELLGTRI